MLSPSIATENSTKTPSRSQNVSGHSTRSSALIKEIVYFKFVGETMPYAAISR